VKNNSALARKAKENGYEIEIQEAIIKPMKIIFLRKDK